VSVRWLANRKKQFVARGENQPQGSMVSSSPDCYFEEIEKRFAVIDQTEASPKKTRAKSLPMSMR
jgi:hypothetical protein